MRITVGDFQDRLLAILKAKLDHELEMQWLQHKHDDLWGVPCGPTLDMVPEQPKVTSFERYLRGDL